MSRELRSPSAAVALHVACILALGMFAPPADAVAQEPTVKPTRMRVAPRLPAPQQVEVQQTGDAELTVTWQPVPGAKAYNLGRAVGTNGFQRVADGIGLQQARYVDRALQPGVRVVYSITPIDASDVAGTRATSEPFTAWRVAAPVGGGTGGTGSTGGTGTTVSTLDPPQVILRVEGTTIHAGWSEVRGADKYVIRLVGPTPSEQTVPSSSAGSERATFSALTPGDYMAETMAIDTSTSFLDPERRSPLHRSGVVRVVGDTLAAPEQAAPAIVDVASHAIGPSGSALSLRISGRLRLTADGVGRWVSLSPNVVAAANDGTLTGMAAGSAMVLGYGGVAGGARVTVVEVVVAP